MSDFAKIENALKAERLQKINPHYDTWVEFYALQEAAKELDCSIDTFSEDIDARNLKEHSGFMESMRLLKSRLENSVALISGFLEDDDA